MNSTLANLIFLKQLMIKYNKFNQNMRYLFIAFLFVSLFGHSQGIEPSSFQGNPNKSGFLKSVTLNVDDFGDTTYLYVHVDSLSVLDSIYLQGDSLIVLKKGSGQVYKSRIYDYNVTSVYYYDIPNPQKGDIYIDDQYDGSQKSRYYDGSSWITFDYDSHLGNEGVLSLEQEYDIWNSVRIRSTGAGSGSEVTVKGDTLIRVSYDEIVPILRLKIDTTTLLDLTTQYLNPYVVTGDTVGFYLTVAVDTVLFQNTIDTASYCCPPSFSGDTLYIGDNYVELPKENLIGGWGITATESPAYTWNIIADSSQVATQYDLSLVSGSQTLSIDSTNRVFTVSISGGNSVKFKDTGGVDSTSVVNSYGTTITESPANQWNIKVDSSKFATTYDLTQVSGSSSKTIDILGSDFTTSATSLQSTALAYTFPSTGTYEVKIYGSYTCSNTANGINVGFIDSGGLVASYITGKHMAFTNNTSSSSTETRKPISAIGTTLSTASVSASSTKYTVMSEVLITVSTTGTITFGFASGSGSYSATLQAGSSLIVEKLN